MSEADKPKSGPSPGGDVSMLLWEGVTHGSDPAAIIACYLDDLAGRLEAKAEASRIQMDSIFSEMLQERMRGARVEDYEERLRSLSQDQSGVDAVVLQSLALTLRDDPRLKVRLKALRRPGRPRISGDRAGLQKSARKRKARRKVEDARATGTKLEAAKAEARQETGYSRSTVHAAMAAHEWHDRRLDELRLDHAVGRALHPVVRAVGCDEKIPNARTVAVAAEAFGIDPDDIRAALARVGIPVED